MTLGSLAVTGIRVCLFSFFAQYLLTAADNWSIIWSDEFEGSRLDPAKWVYTTGGEGFGNNELQYYSRSRRNVYLNSGLLVIQARKEDHIGTNGWVRHYTSGRIRTETKFSHTYGRFEARIKLPFGQGIWSAFWLLGGSTAEWPRNGEIDIIENIGKESSTIHGTIHGPGYSGARGIGAAYSLPAHKRLCDDFHVFAVEWDPGIIRWYVDGELYNTVRKVNLPVGAPWVFDHPFYLNLNVAVGGNWAGEPDASTEFPQSMYVDYVRVYKRI